MNTIITHLQHAAQIVSYGAQTYRPNAQARGEASTFQSAASDSHLIPGIVQPMGIARVAGKIAVSFGVLLAVGGCTTQSGSYSGPAQPNPPAVTAEAWPQEDQSYLSEEQPISERELAAAILDQLLYEEIEPQYRAVGIDLTFSDWEDLSDTICVDMRGGGDGYYTIGDMEGVSEVSQLELAETAWTLLALACDPSLSESDMERMVDLHVRIAPEHSRRLAEAGIESPAMPEYPPVDSGYVEDTYTQGYDPLPPYSGTGSRVRCQDGSYSNAGGKQGACSWHGGVSK